jgi:hypothetical protein
MSVRQQHGVGGRGGGRSEQVALGVQPRLPRRPGDRIASDEDLPELGKAKFAVSRLQSGSHLMAKFYAQRETGVLLGDEQFVVSQNIDGARKVLANGTADYFLWEKWCCISSSGNVSYLVFCSIFHKLLMIEPSWH